LTISRQVAQTSHKKSKIMINICKGIADNT